METKEQVYSNAAIGNDQKLLDAIHQKEVSIAIYERNIEPLKSDLAVVMEKDITCKSTGKIDVIASELDTFFSENLPECNTLFEDILWLLTRFNLVAKASSYRLLLSTINSNMCRKFHTDINDLRLLCTYVGPGTLWLSEDDSYKENHKKNHSDSPINENQIQQANTGDVLILKGALYPEGNPIVHRSPTIKEEGSKAVVKRLMLRLDTNEFLNFE